ncbi:MAG: ABC transporter substrate-binding protein [Lachnospiraceae bacterium]|nr:ABC transporter substrate-binding protein [Lachnospiraceae bacterium]
MKLLRFALIVLLCLSFPAFFTACGSTSSEDGEGTAGTSGKAEVVTDSGDKSAGNSAENASAPSGESTSDVNAGGSSSGTDLSLTEVTLCEVAHSIFYAPQYCAIELGYFEDEGIDLTLYNGSGADNVMTALISGDADIGFMGSESSIYVYAQGATDYAVNFAQLTQRAGNFLVSRTDEADFAWEDLVGATVLGGRAGGMPQMIFEYILKQHGIDPATDLTIIQNIDFGLTAAAFSNGTADYTVEFEPFATSLEAAGEGYVIASLGEESGYVPYTAYSVLKSYLAEHEDVIQAFTNAIQRGLDYVNSHTPEEIARVIAPQFSETDVDTLTTIVERYYEQDTWKEDTIFTQEAFELLEDILMEADELESAVSYEDLVTTVFSEKAIRQ